MTLVGSSFSGVWNKLVVELITYKSKRMVSDDTKALSQYPIGELTRLAFLPLGRDRPHAPLHTPAPALPSVFDLLFCPSVLL
jgi:hypothetical protein